MYIVRMEREWKQLLYFTARMENKMETAIVFGCLGRRGKG